MKDEDLIYLFTGTSEIFIKNRMNRIIQSFNKYEYTIIKSISKNVSNTLVEEKKDNTGRQRYYDNVFYIRGKNVLLSSEWYDGTGRKPDNKTIFINWLRSFVYASSS